MPAARGRLLVVDDAPDTLEVLERNLSAAGYDVETARGVREAIAALGARAVDVVITDLKMPGASGMELVRHVRENCKDTAVLMITGYPSVEGAVQAVKIGAEDFLAKPFTDEELLRAVRGAFERLAARRTVEGAQAEPGRSGLLGESEPMRRVSRAIARAAAVDAPVLLVGESGTGKELAARAIHYASSRSGGPFVTVELASVPPEQAEAEIFGSAGGGASPPGLWSAARAGTLFLDEIAAAPAGLQAALAAALEEPAEHRGPGQAPRVIAATTRDLHALAGRQAFREDLFYRLGAVSLELPPLRERGDDILLLVNTLASRSAQSAGRPVPRFSDRAIEALRNYAWPGNVRELKSVVERLVVMSGDSVVDVPDLPSLMRFSALRTSTPFRSLAEVEAEHIREVLAAVEGNRTRAAEILGIDRKTLREKMKRAAGPDAEPEHD